MAKISIDFDRKKIILHQEVSPKELEQLIASISSFPLETKMEKTTSLEEFNEKIKKQITRNNDITWIGGPYNADLLKPTCNPKVPLTFSFEDKQELVKDIPYRKYGEHLDD